MSGTNKSPQKESVKSVGRSPAKLQISTGLFGCAFGNTQYFLYGLPNEEFFWCQTNLTDTGERALLAKVGYNSVQEFKQLRT